MMTTWTQQFSQSISDQTLPLALAMLLANNSKITHEAQLARLKTELPFVTSIWFGETPGKIIDFSAARNSVLNQISEPWVFWLDSDEVLASPDLAFNHLKKFLIDQTILGLTLSREDWLHQKPLKFGETNAAQFLRIHRTQAGRFTNQVHEVFSPKKIGKVAASSLKIYHHSHNSLAEFFSKICHYAQIRAEERSSQIPTPTKNQLFWELCCWPAGKFWYIFFWQQGWRDGFRGLIYAVMMSLHSALVRIFGLEILLNEFHKNHEI